MKNYQYRLISRVVIEAATPLSVGSGVKDIYTDATVAKDVNNLPYIPGASIAGVVRHALHALEEKLGNLSSFFGFQKSEQGQGSEIIFSEAKMIGKDGLVIDGLQNIDFTDAFYSQFKSLPVRQHVRISDMGAAEKHGKFDEEVVLKGTRFCFEIEVVSQTPESETFIKVLNALFDTEFRIGSGSRKGFGKISVISCASRIVDLSKKEDLNWYLNHKTDLSIPFDGKSICAKSVSEATVYTLTLRPESFFLFGAGFGDDEADLIPVSESQISWSSDGKIEKPYVKENMLLIPASSIKGALSHRVAFHYNVKHNAWAEQVSSKEQKDAYTVNNPAVNALFGSADPNKKKRGIVLFEDIIAEAAEEQIMSHVEIDRFTGGAIDGALFQEKATYGKGKCFKTHIIVVENAEAHAIEALELAMIDICKGMLPLGGATNKGYGCFNGKLEKNDETIFSNID